MSETEKKNYRRLILLRGRFGNMVYIRKLISYFFFQQGIGVELVRLLPETHPPTLTNIFAEADSKDDVPLKNLTVLVRGRDGYYYYLAPWERLKFILVTHLLYSPEKTQKTRDITNSRAGERHFIARQHGACVYMLSKSSIIYAVLVSPGFYPKPISCSVQKLTGGDFFDVHLYMYVHT
ncbi:hypothetical protein NQ317_010111 [Molorchus minor]|uniref:Uncharacterized protein n=1 Tax=Molorchus minor TaxID=1323400 RepID=A0ABQ9JA16_9CUCU|nr:hypothetical protein NQ317_010111 [Molorchus minor]